VTGARLEALGLLGNTSVWPAAVATEQPGESLERPSVKRLICLAFAAIALPASGQPQVDELSGRATVSKQQAEWLVRQVKTHAVIDLNSLVEINLDTAKALAAHNGGVSLRGLKKLTPEAARALAECRGGLYLSHRVLSPAVYVAILNHSGLLEIGDLEELSANEAEAIAEHQGAVSLPAIKSLSPEAAKSLQKHRGGLRLEQVALLSPDAANALANYSADLHLPGLSTLGEVALAAKLARGGGELRLPGLKSLSPSIAEQLGRHQGSLWLDGIQSLDFDAAWELAKHKGEELHLSGLKGMPIETATALGTHSGSLFLNGLREISVEVAQELSKHRGDLHVTAASEMSNKAMLVLLASECRVHLRAGAGQEGMSDFSGRQDGQRGLLVRIFGGSDATEAAVANALVWMADQQGRDGLWSLQGPYADGGSQENKLAATAMALLAFQGAGNTPTTGRHKDAVARGWKGLLAKQLPDGSFDLALPSHHRLYAHAQATYALCELVGMTDGKLHFDQARRALDYSLAAQAANGGWRYAPREPGDMSVTGWFMMALKSGEMAGLKVPPATFNNATKFLDAVSIDGGSRYGYQLDSPQRPPSGVTAAVTAEGLLARQFLGWGRDDERIAAGLEHVMGERLLDFEKDKDVYAWYYITQVAHNVGGAVRDKWNARMREVVPAQQVEKGPEAGSWDPTLDKWGHIGGRLYTTCFLTYMLEVYYRYPSLYRGQNDAR